MYFGLQKINYMHNHVRLNIYLYLKINKHLVLYEYFISQSCGKCHST